jgi:hypothetical protein
VAVSALAAGAAALRAVVATGSVQIILAKVVITAMAVFWIELLVYGVLCDLRRNRAQNA